MGKRTQLTSEQRIEAVLSLLRREKSAAKITRRYGISEPTIANRILEKLSDGRL